MRAAPLCVVFCVACFCVALRAALFFCVACFCVGLFGVVPRRFESRYVTLRRIAVRCGIETEVARNNSCR